MDGEQIRIARNLKRMSQYQLELLCGVFQSKISLIERGLRIPTEEEERKIMSALGLLVEGTGPAPFTSQEIPQAGISR